MARGLIGLGLATTIVAACTPSDSEPLPVDSSTDLESHVDALDDAHDDVLVDVLVDVWEDVHVDAVADALVDISDSPSADTIDVVDPEVALPNDAEDVLDAIATDILMDDGEIIGMDIIDLDTGPDVDPDSGDVGPDPAETTDGFVLDDAVADATADVGDDVESDDTPSLPDVVADGAGPDTVNLDAVNLDAGEPDVVPADSVEEPSVCPQWAPGDFEVTIGDIDSSAFEPLVEGGTIEIVQGPQGGIHLEVAFRAEPSGVDGSVAYFTVDARAYQAADGEPVASYENPTAPWFATGDGAWWSASVVPIIFEVDVADPYQDLPCCVTVEVGLKDGKTGPVVAVARATLALECVDYL